MTHAGDFYNLIFSDQYLLDSNISPLIEKISEGLEEQNFVRLWNLASYLTDMDICFYPSGRKCNQQLIDKLWSEENGESKIRIIKEFRIPYSHVLLKNIFRFYNRNFIEKTMRLQKYIYGYCVLCPSEHRGKFKSLSHVFTNENTWKLLSKKETKCHNKQIKFLTETLDTDKKKIFSCVTGAAAEKIFGEENNNDFLETEIWSCLRGTNMKTIETLSINTKKLKLPTSKILWFDKCYLLPKQHITVDDNGYCKDSYDFITQENMFCYYKGIKFLHGNHNSDMTLKTIVNGNLNRKVNIATCRVSKKINVTKAWDEKFARVTMVKNAKYKDFKILVSGMWILKNNGAIDILNKEYLPLLSLGFAATGIFNTEKSQVNIIPANQHSSSNNVLQYLKSRIGTSETIFLNFKKHSKVLKKSPKKGFKKRIVKKKKPIIQDESKGYHIPSLSTLLPGN